MLEELEILIDFIIQEYAKLTKKWEECNSYVKINQKKKLVIDIKEDSQILESILNYRSFINEKHLDLKVSFNELHLKNRVSSRVKAQNSIELKFQKYLSKKQYNGKGPINKCFNDIYGIRIIFKDSVSFEEIESFIKKKYNNRTIKCINSSKDNYVATHIYFKKDNYSFQWELQIWDEEHEKANFDSHSKYKQEYTKWEKENKGGESF